MIEVSASLQRGFTPAVPDWFSLRNDPVQVARTAKEETMKLMRATPTLGTMKQNLARVFERFFEPTFWPLGTQRGMETMWEPTLDFSETEKEFIVRLQGPGGGREGRRGGSRGGWGCGGGGGGGGSRVGFPPPCRTAALPSSFSPLWGSPS